jgi:hypothetical protein
VIVLGKEAQKVGLNVTLVLEQEAHCKISAKYLKEAIKVENLVCFHLWGKLVANGRDAISHFLILLCISLCSILFLSF